MYRCLILVAAALAAGCDRLADDAKDAVRTSLPDPYSATFEALRSYPGDVVCGTVSANDMSGMRRLKQRFVYDDGRVLRRPDKREVALFCTDTPAQALVETLGIGPWGEDNTTLMRIYGDLKAFEAAIDAYRRDHGDIPLQGLFELAPPEGDYLEALPRDPWDRDYDFSVGLGGRSNRNYTLRTLGADGAPGGDGENADVGREFLPYLDRLARL